MKDNCFEIIKVKDVEGMLKEEARDLDDSDGFLNTNLCLIYKINPSKVAIVPNSVLAEQDCILFTNNKCYQEALKMDQFPIGVEVNLSIGKVKKK